MNLNLKRNQIFIAIAFGIIIASLSYPIVTIVLAFQFEGYSHMQDLISELGVSNLPYAWVLTAVLLFDGLLLFGLAYAVHQSIGQRDRYKLAPIMIGVFGVTLLIGGLFPCDVDCRPESINGWIHNLNFLPSIIAFVSAPFFLQKKFANEERLPSFFSTFSFILGVLMIFFVLASVVLFPTLDLAGFGQRLVLALQLSFFSLTAAAVIHVNLSQTSLGTYEGVSQAELADS